MPKCTVDSGASNGPDVAGSVAEALPAPAADVEVPEPAGPVQAVSEPPAAEPQVVEVPEPEPVADLVAELVAAVDAEAKPGPKGT